MGIISLCIFLGLLALQVKLAFILGLLAGMLSFIPNFGPLTSAVPAILLGFSEGSTKGLLVIALFAIVEVFESYILLPLL